MIVTLAEPETLDDGRLELRATATVAGIDIAELSVKCHSQWSGGFLRGVIAEAERRGFKFKGWRP